MKYRRRKYGSKIPNLILYLAFQSKLERVSINSLRVLFSIAVVPINFFPSWSTCGGLKQDQIWISSFRDTLFFAKNVKNDYFKLIFPLPELPKYWGMYTPIPPRSAPLFNSVIVHFWLVWLIVKVFVSVDGKI